MSVPLTLRRAALAVVLALGGAPLAHAAHLGVSAGRSITSAHRWTSVAFLDATGSTHVTEGVHWQPAVVLGWIDGRNSCRERMNHDVFVGGAGVRLVDWWRRAFFSFQLGVAGGRTDALSSAGQFISTLGWQEPHYQLMLRHISNGHVFRGKNLGETMLLVGFRI